MDFTVFTPTYNRAYLLPQLYESLLRQTSKSFEWLVIDDGSTDDTESLINGYIEEGKITIRYYKQPNSGKHIAVNKALEVAKGKYFTTIDSDDYVVEEFIEVCEKLSEEVEGKEEFCGFAFIHTSPKTKEERSEYGRKRWTELHGYEWKFKGETSFVYKLDIIKKFPFPVFENEKFCQEAVQILRILRNYKILFTDYILAQGEYLEDGLSQNLYKRLLANPRYAMLSYKEKIMSYGTYEEKLKMAESYWDIARKTGGGILKNIFGLPLHWTIKVFMKKILK